jgi:hypothetical protein
VGLTFGATTVGTDSARYSLTTASASVSAIPAASLLIELKVAGATASALALGKRSGSPGSLKSWRTGRPASSASPSRSAKRAPSGVTTTQTSQPARLASRTNSTASAAGGAPHTMW